MKTRARFALAVLLVWLRPWKAAGRIQGQEEAIHYLIKTTLGLLEERDGKPRPVLRVIEGGKQCANS